MENAPSRGLELATQFGECVSIAPGQMAGRAVQNHLRRVRGWGDTHMSGLSRQPWLTFWEVTKGFEC